MSKFSSRFKQARIANGMKQREVTDGLSLQSSGTVSNWESGSREPSISALIELSKLFDCSIDWLVGNDNLTTYEDGIDKTIDLRKIRYLRSYHKKTQEQMGELIKTSDSNYGHKENGARAFSLQEAKILADYFGETIESLFFGECRQPKKIIFNPFDEEKTEAIESALVSIKKEIGKIEELIKK